MKQFYEIAASIIVLLGAISAFMGDFDMAIFGVLMGIYGVMRENQLAKAEEAR